MSYHFNFLKLSLRHSTCPFKPLINRLQFLFCVKIRSHLFLHLSSYLPCPHSHFYSFNYIYVFIHRRRDESEKATCQLPLPPIGRHAGDPRYMVPHNPTHPILSCPYPALSNSKLFNSILSYPTLS